MGYVHDVNFSVFVHPSLCGYGGWTWTNEVKANGWLSSRTAADASFNLLIPVRLWGNSAAYRGCKLVSADIWWEVTTAAMDEVTAYIYQSILPINGDEFAAPTLIVFTYDAGHNDAAERITVDQHKMTVTLTTPVWVDEDDKFYIRIVGDAALTSIFNFYGARLNFTFRS